MKLLKGSAGDEDRALHIWRGEQMRKGCKLSEVTMEHCNRIGVESRVMPMSDDPVETVIETQGGEMDMHQFWVKNGGRPDVSGVRFKGLGRAKALEDAVQAILVAEKIIIGPSNPVTSIYPILSLPGIKGALRKNKSRVIAISPLLGGSAFSGPAEKLMKAFGIAVSARGLAGFYGDVVSNIIIDSSETYQSNAVRTHKTDIVMDNLKKRLALAKYVLDVIL
jgi:LPPG:FO 2-phospho-L-lactate transferase